MTTEQAEIDRAVAEGQANEQSRGLAMIVADLSAVEAKAQAGGMTLDQLQALAKEASRLRSERDKVATAAERGVRDEILERYKGLKFTLPKDATVQVMLKRDGDRMLVQSASIVSPTLIDAIYSTIGDVLLADTEKVTSIRGVMVSADGTSLNVPSGSTKTASTGGNAGSGTQKRVMVVDGVRFDSGAEAYKATFGVEKLPYAMNWDAVAAKLRNRDGKDSHQVTE